MPNKDNSELLNSDLVEDEDEYYYQSYLAMKKEILDYAKSEIAKKEVKEEVAKAETNALARGSEEKEKDVIVNSYKEKIPVETIAKICKTSLAKVNKIIKEYCL